MEEKRQGAAAGAWVCLLLGSGLLIWNISMVLLSAPLLLASFVLSIVAIAQRRIASGISSLLLSVVIPIGGIAIAWANSLRASISDQRPVAGPTTPDNTLSLEAGSHQARTASVSSAEAEGRRYAEEFLELYAFRARYYQSYSGSAPGVEFKLRNKGKRTLNRVVVTVYFKDASGSVIAEEEYSPVWVVKGFASSNDKPLKPGYIWQMERDKFYQAKSVPSEWKPGKDEAKITKVEFAD